MMILHFVRSTIFHRLLMSGAMTDQLGLPCGPFAKRFAQTLPPLEPELQLKRNSGTLRDLEAVWKEVLLHKAKLKSSIVAVDTPNSSRAMTLEVLLIKSTLMKLPEAAGPIAV